MDERAAPPGPDAPDALPVAFRGGGELRVATVGSSLLVSDALLAHLERLRELHEAADAVAAVVAGAAGWTDWAAVPGVPAALRHAGRLLDEAATRLRAIAERAAALDAAARVALAGAEQGEAAVQHGLRLASAVGAWELGAIGVPLLLMLATNPFVLAGLVAGGAILASDGGLARLQRWFLDHPRIITSPEFVEFVRLAVQSRDDLDRGARGVPLPLDLVVGESTAGGELASGGAAVILAGTAFGVLRDSDTVARPVRASAETAPPRGARERLDRIPEGGRVRIEVYEAPGEPRRVAVYVGPTDTFSVLPTDAAEDMRSNIEGVAGGNPASTRAVVQAMRDAGVTAEDEVQFLGYSQGGIVAAQLAASGDWNAVGLETYAAPTGGVDLPEGLAGMAVRNSDDLVPALGGPQRDTDLLQVERRAFTPGDDVPPIAVPAHQKDAYRATADAIDRADSAAVREQVARMDAFAAEIAGRDGATVTASEYELDRVWQDAPQGGR